EFGTFFRFLVGPYVVAQTIGKLAHDDLRINRHRLGQRRRLSKTANGDERDDECKQDYFLHSSLRESSNTDERGLNTNLPAEDKRERAPSRCPAVIRICDRQVY